MAAANGLARPEHKASFPGDIFHEGAVSRKATWTFVHQKQLATDTFSK